MEKPVTYLWIGVSLFFVWLLRVHVPLIIAVTAGMSVYGLSYYEQKKLLDATYRRKERGIRKSVRQHKDPEKRKRAEREAKKTLGALAKRKEWEKRCTSELTALLGVGTYFMPSVSAGGLYFMHKQRKKVEAGN